MKPWNLETIRQKMDLVKAADPCAIAMDIDAAGLPFLKGLTPPAGSKTVDQLKDIAAMAGKPFILKGIMTVAGAEKALEAGAAGIVVSNHGGRVLDQCPATAEVLPAIADAVGGKMKIFVDGGIRSGMDVFKALALGADAVLIARPFVTMVYGGAAGGRAGLCGQASRQSWRTPWPCAAPAAWPTSSAPCSSAFKSDVARSIGTLARRTPEVAAPLLSWTLREAHAGRRAQR